MSRWTGPPRCTRPRCGERLAAVANWQRKDTPLDLQWPPELVQSSQEVRLCRTRRGSGRRLPPRVDAEGGGYVSVPSGTTLRVRVEPDRGRYRVTEVLTVDTRTAWPGEP